MRNENDPKSQFYLIFLSAETVGEGKATRNTKHEFDIIFCCDFDVGGICCQRHETRETVSMRRHIYLLQVISSMMLTKQLLWNYSFQLQQMIFNPEYIPEPVCSRNQSMENVFENLFFFENSKQSFGLQNVYFVFNNF